MDRNTRSFFPIIRSTMVALRKESVDRNFLVLVQNYNACVALRKESVDRNCEGVSLLRKITMSLSARRAWIEIVTTSDAENRKRRRSPQGERG